MLDEQQEDAPAAEGDDDAVDVADAVDAGDAGGGGDDDAIDIGEAGADVQTADEPAVSAEALQEIPDAPERWDDSGEIIEPGAAGAGEERAQAAADAGAAAAAEDTGGGGGDSDE